MSAQRIGTLIRLELTQRVRSVAWYVLLGIFFTVLLAVTLLAFASFGFRPDSGGGVFVTVNGTRYLIGINSYSGAVSPATSNSKYGGLSGAVDLQQFYPWIFANTGIAAVPEPGAWWLCALGGLLCLVRRR